MRPVLPKFSLFDRICRSVGAASILALFSAAPAAAQQLYDFSRLLAEPHPFTVAAPAPVPLPAGTAPLPGQAVPMPAQRAIYPSYPAYPSYPVAQPVYPNTPYPVAQNAPARRTAPQPAVAMQEPERMLGEKTRHYDPLWGWISEIRIGASAHNYGPFAGQVEGGVDADFEILLDEITWFDHYIKTPGKFWEWFLRPRPHFGLHYNSAGLTHQFWGGFAWTYLFNKRWFGEITFGLDVHTGKLTDPTENRRELGSRILFRESLAIGYMFGSGRNHNISIYIDHISHGGLFASENEGMDNIGARYGYRF